MSTAPKTPETPEQRMERLRAAGAKGGRACTAAKATAARRNAGRPDGKGKRRGWPAGRPRGPLSEAHRAAISATRKRRAQGY